jgi:DNA-binding MurR/RpiR family transcriptional regulator
MRYKSLMLNSWLALQKVLDVVRDDQDYGRLDERSQRILDWVVGSQNSVSTMFVQDVVTGSGVASPATVHKCLANLDRNGFLNFAVDPEDSRRRIVTPTDKTRKTYKDLDVRVARWIREQRKA